MQAILLVGLALASTLGFASDDHGIGKISTEELDLSYIDHVLTGRIGDRPVFAKPLKDGFGLYLWHRAKGKDFETTLKALDGTIQGDVRSIDLNGKEIKESFQITEYSVKDGALFGRVGEQDFAVQVSSEVMNGHHYIDPHFVISIDGRDQYEFDLKNSQACMGCIIKLSYAIIAMLYSYGAF